MFLELTRVRAVALPIALPLAAWLLSPTWMIIGYSTMALGALAGEVLARTVRGPERRIVRRLWWLSLPYAQGTWVGGAFAVGAYLWSDPYSRYVISGSYGVLPWGTDFIAVYTLAAAAIGGLCGLFVWLWRWRRMCRLLGLPELIRSGPCTQRAMLVTHFIPLSLAAVVLLCWLGLALVGKVLDWFPGMYS